MVKCFSENYLLACLKSGKKLFPKILFYKIAVKYNKYKGYIDKQELEASQQLTRELDRTFSVKTYKQEFPTCKN